MLVGKYKQRMFAPVDGASLAVFRMLLGFTLLVEVWRYLEYQWIEQKYIHPVFLFKYHGFEWVQPWSPEIVFWAFRLLAICSFLFMVGLYYRLAAWGMLISFSYIFLLDKTQYLNHFYFTILLIFAMALVPGNQVWSLDRLIGRVKKHDFVPNWALWLTRGQMEIMLIWAGLVKLNGDWLAGKPLVDWLAGRAYRLPDPISTLMQNPDFGVIAAWGVAALHIVGAPLLFVPRVRVLVFFTYVTFHCLNHLMWDIGIFPWLTIAGTMLFFAASWPRDIMSRAGISKYAAMLPSSAPAFKYKPMVAVFVLSWLVFQAALPVRSYLFYEGPPAWNEQGHRFSWRMKLRDRDATLVMKVRDPASGQEWIVDQDEFLTTRQQGKMAARPSMILEFAHYIRDHWREAYGVAGPEVYVKSFVSVNGRPYQQFIDDKTDLAKVPKTFFRQDDWILPFAEGEEDE